MSNSLYSPRRLKIEFTEASRFRAGDEFVTRNGKLVYLRLMDLKA